MESQDSPPPPSRVPWRLVGGTALVAACVAAGYFRFARPQRGPTELDSRSAATLPVATSSATAGVAPSSSAIAGVAASSASAAVAVPSASALAETPPPPDDVASGSMALYGVIYDLMTLNPVPDADVGLSCTGSQVKTDVRGWYRFNLGQGGLEGASCGVNVEKVGYSKVLQERDVPLASLSVARRRGIAEESGAARIAVRYAGGAESVELDIALVPYYWPSNVPPAEYSAARDPPPRAPVNPENCVIYGVAYDAITKQPLRNALLRLHGATGYETARPTDGFGFFDFLAPVREVEPPGLEISLVSPHPGYKEGLAADTKPPLRRLGEAARRRRVGELRFETVPVPEGCDDGVIRLDLVALPVGRP